MNNWFNVKVKYTKELDNGTFKRVSEPYLVAAMSFSDAETRIYEELGMVVRGEFQVVGMKREDLHDIFAYDDSDVWYKAIVTYVSQDGLEESGKKVKQTFLVGAHSVDNAYDRIKESLATLLVDFEIPKVEKSQIVEIFPPSENLDREISRTPIEEFKKNMEDEGMTVQFSTSGTFENEETIQENN